MASDPSPPCRCRHRCHGCSPASAGSSGIRGRRYPLPPRPLQLQLSAPSARPALLPLMTSPHLGRRAQFAPAQRPRLSYLHPLDSRTDGSHPPAGQSVLRRPRVLRPSDSKRRYPREHRGHQQLPERQRLRPTLLSRIFRFSPKATSSNCTALYTRSFLFPLSSSALSLPVQMVAPVSRHKAQRAEDPVERPPRRLPCRTIGPCSRE